MWPFNSPTLPLRDTHCTATPRPLALSQDTHIPAHTHAHTYTHTHCGPGVTSFLQRSGSWWIIFHPTLPPLPIWDQWYPPVYRKWVSVCVCVCEDSGQVLWGSGMFCMSFFFFSLRLAEINTRAGRQREEMADTECQHRLVILCVSSLSFFFSRAHLGITTLLYYNF